MTQLDRDAVLAAMQDEIDDLTETCEAQQKQINDLASSCEAQQKQLDVQWQLLVELAVRNGLPRPEAPGR